MELRPLRTADLAALAAWLPRAADEIGCQRWASEAALRAAVGKKSALVGPDCIVAFETGAPERDAARVGLLAVAPGRRRLGIGGRAALALEQRLVTSVARLYVVVPATLGLALYFWLRLGYRPLTQRDWPAPAEQAPSVWMLRELV